jgi:hypothetical protein
MKLEIRYPTKERKYINGGAYQHCTKDAELEPVRIFRSSCGLTGAASKRFYYEAEFVAPDDAAFVHEEKIRANINRKTNPKFNPNELEFNGNIWVSDASQDNPVQE